LRLGLDVLKMKINRLSSPNCRVGLSAFTLAEVMVAVLVVSVVFVSLFTGVSSGFALVKLAREDLRATQIMLQRMEAVRLYTWSQITNANYFSTNTVSEYYDPAGQAAGSGGVAYSVSTAVSTDTPAGTYAPNMRRVTVQVSWLSGKIQRKREVSTFVARYGMQNYIYKE
jgi:Tfp pilus assembly protein PilV